MPFWIALAVLLVAVAGGLAYAIVRGFQLWRDGKRASGTFSLEMDRINAVTLEIERHMGEADAATRRLAEATERLAVSRARLQIQLAAVREARAQMRRVFWFVPGV
jgi:cytochrome c-type biogenesis protein CcmH/NrfG